MQISINKLRSNESLRRATLVRGAFWRAREHYCDLIHELVKIVHTTAATTTTTTTNMNNNVLMDCEEEVDVKSDNINNNDESEPVMSETFCNSDNISSLSSGSDTDIIVPVITEPQEQQHNPTLKTLRSYLKRKQFGGCYSDVKRLRLSTNTIHQEEPCIT
ncbi:unnamed protein product [Didymodactylos carnosus]|uniref:Uncharacterized protein n=1 Tax=Didymodactylos carnosus TaxID=1234261 RepID=A0A814MNT6_9BILA|nr:unnamed protein product [Didymodactylos carnosus]CAF1080439.1 unnamed protein product [Didymodactylos carnosus]CAF3677517.1 unnamed protein product [Didymodactylos carnosus]CAF3846411.1 unnamed protein product [Didymodactylos carnosus]